MSPFVKTLLVSLFAAGGLGAVHRLLDPSQCAAVLNEHSGAVALAGAAIGALALWIKSPAQRQ